MTTLNVSHLILRCYPERAPWDLIPTSMLACSDISSLSIQYALPERLQRAALAQAQRTGLNPFHRKSWNNPYVLDNESVGCTSPTPIMEFGSPLPPAHPSPPDAIIIGEVIHTNPATGCIVCTCRVQGQTETRILKLFTGKEAQQRFQAEVAAHVRLSRMADGDSVGAVPQYHGWVEIEYHLLQSMVNLPGSSQSLRMSVDAHGVRGARGILMEDLTRGKTLSIDNIDAKTAHTVLKSLHAVHRVHVVHGQLTRHNVLVLPSEQRVVWLGFSHAVCRPHEDETELTRRLLLAELAEGWDLVYTRLLADSLIGFKADENQSLIDPKTLSVAYSRITPVESAARPRPASISIQDEIITLLLSYPEVDIFSWSPPVYNLIPQPRLDHRYDDQDFLDALKATLWEKNHLDQWHGMCPLLIEWSQFECGIKTFEEYKPPQSIPQLSSDTTIEFLAHVFPRGNHPLIRVRIGTEERVLKIFSKEKREGYNDVIDAKERFEAELDAYAHLVHYGASASGAVPHCYGWIELSPAHVYDAIKLIKKTRERGFEPEEEPLWVSPIFDDGTLSRALVLECLPDSEAISLKNTTHEIAELAMRALGHVHRAYVLHGDLTNLDNIRVVLGDGPLRVIILDFDHSNTHRGGGLNRLRLLSELRDMWGTFFEIIIPQQRIFCQRDHPHEGASMVGGSGH
ncbi:hypothetical protein BC628DRAFT_1428522 [Trametes gibbosa]|nr:hypothetical protein BC628DRAFT_1428522 [Trametes gibbosa]